MNVDMNKTISHHLENNKVIRLLCHKIPQHYKPKHTIIIGIQGGQGTGKTTVSNFLKQYLLSQGFKVQSFSIDDFYTSYSERQKLPRKYPGNPFYAISRGLPGTHRVKLLVETLQRAKAGKNFVIPSFDKSLHHAAGDIAQKSIPVTGRQDFILFEGWCLTIPTTTSSELLRVCKKNNIPLRKIDPQLKHHKIVLQHLPAYQKIWKKIDYLIMLQPDAAQLHFKWRWQQEQDLRKATGRGMSRKEVERFVAPFLPFTYLIYEKVKPDMLLHINRKHEIYVVG